MKRLWLFIISIFLAAIPLLAAAQATGAGPNLFTNASVETVDPANTNRPLDWTRNQTGNINATQTYVSNSGYTGTHSLLTNVTSIGASGQVKWQHAAVDVTAGATYTYSNYYKSNVSTNVIAEYITATATTLSTLKSVPASATWALNSATFKAPAGTKRVKVYQTIAKVGTLTTDDYSLYKEDATAPTVTLSGPAANTTVSNTLAVTANASDSIGIANVQFKLDGNNLGTADTTSPYSVSWNTVNTTNGSHTLTAVATNTSGLSTTSASVTVNVNNTVPAPTVSISSPVNGAPVSGSVNVTATAANAVGVQFKVDGNAIGSEDTTSPYSTSWDTTGVTNGTHTLTAVARNSQNVTTTSTGIAVTVNNPVPVQLPTVSITAPANSSTISGPITITANATNAAGVQFMLDGVTFSNEDSTAPYQVTWDTRTGTNGTHTITAVARNSANQSVTSAPVQVTVNNQSDVIIDSTNLVANPSTETADPANTTVPQSWTNSSWGTNTPSFTYAANGHSGGHSVRTDITSYTNGDAKWYFAPVAADPNTTYEYSHYYMSNATTDIVAQFTDASGNDTYKYLGTVGPSATWAQFTSGFTTPANVAKVTVLHTLYSTGWLQIDDAYLRVQTPAQQPTAVVPNGSLEQTLFNNGTQPAGWSTGAWGSHNTKFEYLNEGHTGNHSVKTTVSSYIDGDSKWFFNPVTTLVPGKQYRFSTWYKTNIMPRAVAQFNKADGTSVFFGMPNPQPSGSTTEWQYYSETFTVPLGTVSTSAFFFATYNGWIQVDDQAITDYTPTGFNRAMLTLTFDDGFEDNNTTVLPLLNSLGFKSTQCYATQFVTENANNPNLVKQFYNSGHEICSHTVTHPFLTGLTTAQVDQELSQSQQTLQNIIGAPVRDFASPYGDYNPSVNNEIRKYYRSHRTVDEGFNSRDNLDLYRIRVQNIQLNTSLAQVQSWIDQAKATNTWLVLVYHRVATSGLEQFDSKVSDFNAQMQAVKNSGITVKTYSDALDEIAAQQ